MVKIDRVSRICQYFICLLIPIATFFRGGFFPVEYISIAILLLLLTALIKEIKIPVIGALLVSGITIIYYISALFGEYDAALAVSECTKPVILLLAVLIGVNIEKKDFFWSLVSAALLIAFVGILSLSKIIEITDFVYIYNGTRQLQSTMQYANSAAAVLIVGIFSARMLSLNGERRFILSCIEVFLTVCLLFTYSRIAITIYILLTLLELALLNNGTSVSVLTKAIAGTAIFCIMLFFMNQRLSFAALIVCIVLTPILCESIIKIKPASIKIKRVFLVPVAILALVVFSLFIKYADISTLMVRLLYYKDGINALLRNPILGLSPSGWGEYQFEYQTAQYFVKYVHNGILQAGLDAGILAMLLFATALLLPITGLIKKWVGQKDANDLYILLILTFLVAHGFFDFDFSFANILIILGICSAHGYQRYYITHMRSLRTVVCSLLIAFFLYLNYTEILLLSVPNRYKDGDLKNSKYLTEMLNIANNNNDFTTYLQYQNLLFEMAPMQQKTYSEAIRYLDKFYTEGVLTDRVHLEEKNRVISHAVTANNKMSSLNKYLDFGREIDIEISNMK